MNNVMMCACSVAMAMCVQGVIAPAYAKEAESRPWVVMDVDPGADDFMALALCSDAVRDGVPFPRFCVATFGNSIRPTTSRNLALAMRFLEQNPTLVLGADKPYSGIEPKHSDFHGYDAFGGCAAPLMKRYGMTEETVRNGYRGLDVLGRAISESSNVTYIAVGPLTSLAKLLELYPETESRIGRVYVMGGGVKSFNVDEFKSEYNFFEDPEAVKRVFASKLDITLFPLDITHVDARIFADEIDQLKVLTKDQTLVNCLQTNRVSNVASGEASDAAVIHDALPVLYALDPTAFTVEDMTLTVGKGGHLDIDPSGRKVHVATHARPRALFSALERAVRRMGK